MKIEGAETSCVPIPTLGRQMSCRRRECSITHTHALPCVRQRAHLHTHTRAHTYTTHTHTHTYTLSFSLSYAHAHAHVCTVVSKVKQIFRRLELDAREGKEGEGGGIKGLADRRFDYFVNEILPKVCCCVDARACVCV